MKTFENVASLKLARLNANQFVETGGFTEKGGTGAKRYFTKTASQAAADGDVVDDVHTNFVLANGIVAIDTSKPVIEHYTLAEAKALTGAVIGQIVQITDRGNGQFEAVSSITNPPDEFGIIQGQGDIAWKVVVDGSVDVDWVGAVDSTTMSSHESIQYALDTGDDVYGNGKNYLLTETLILKNSRQRFIFSGILLLGGAAGTACLQIGDAGFNVDECKVDINTIEGQDKSAGRDGIRYHYCVLGDINVQKINNCRWGHHERQFTNEARAVHNNIRGLIIRACERGIYKQDAPAGVTLADQEGSDYYINLITGCTQAGMLTDPNVRTNGSLIFINFDAGLNFYINNSEFGQPNILITTDMPEPFDSNILASRDIWVGDGILKMGRRFGRNTLIDYDVDEAQAGLVRWFRGGVEASRIGHEASGDYTIKMGATANEQLRILASGGTILRNRIILAGQREDDFIAGDNNDVDPSASGYMWYITADAAGSTLTGIAGGSGGRQLQLINVGSGSLTIANESLSSGSGNRILNSTGADIVLPLNATLEVFYDSLNSRWRTKG